MSKNEAIILFLGRVQARIEDLGSLAKDTENPLFEVIADLENYFNLSLHEIFSHDEDEISTWRKGIKWNNLPK